MNTSKMGDRKVKNSEIIERITRLEAKISNGLVSDIEEIKNDIRDIKDKLNCVMNDVSVMKEFYSMTRGNQDKLIRLEQTVDIDRAIYISGVILVILVSILRWILKV